MMRMRPTTNPMTHSQREMAVTILPPSRGWIGNRLKRLMKKPMVAMG